MEKITNPEVAAVFNSYPEKMRKKLMSLRHLVLETAKETGEVGTVEETLKWGEPSYITENGSTLRMDWKERSPDQYAMYFQCTTTLVDTFRELYRDTFTFEGNRAIIFHEDDEIPVGQLKHYISLALTYHDRKHFPMLGACEEYGVGNALSRTYGECDYL